MAANYVRLIRECEGAQEFMTQHFAGTAPTLRQYCDDHDLVYLRMINRTYPLKKVTEEECNRILAAALVDYRAKVNGHVRRAPGAGRPAAPAAAPAEEANMITISVEEYRRIIHLAQDDREKQFRIYDALRQAHGAPCTIQPPQPKPELATKEQVEADIRQRIARWQRIHPVQPESEDEEEEAEEEDEEEEEAEEEAEAEEE